MPCLCQDYGTLTLPHQHLCKCTLLQPVARAEQRTTFTERYYSALLDGTIMLLFCSTVYAAQQALLLTGTCAYARLHAHTELVLQGPCMYN